MKTKKLVLVFVMGSDASPYPQLMRASRETWDLIQVEGVPTFYFTNPVRDEPPRTLQFQVGGDLCDMGHKCLAAYRWALDTLIWDYMARVNASCYIRKAALIEYVQTLPDANLFRGVKTLHAGKPYLWGGAHFLISRDVVKKFVENGEKWDHREMEDVAMSRLAEQLAIPLDGSGMACSINKRPNDWVCIAYGEPSFEFNNFGEFKAKVGGQFFIRVKQDLKRDQDIWIMQELWKAGV